MSNHFESTNGTQSIYFLGIIDESQSSKGPAIEQGSPAVRRKPERDVSRSESSKDQGTYIGEAT